MDVSIVIRMNEEETLIAAALEGDGNAFERLLLPYRQRILTLAFRMTGNMEDSREISQEAVMKIYRYLRSYQPGRSFKNWLYKTVVNTSNDFLAKRGRQMNIIEEHKDPGLAAGRSTPEKRYLHLEIREKIRQCLALLSPRERAVYLLRDGEGLSIRETCRALGASSSSVRTHLCRARRKIRARFEEIYMEKGR
jgi:RNA polymerase sigma-70 factor (ECF subfamily)